MPQFKSALINRSLSITRKKAELKKIANVSKEEQQLTAILGLLAGAKVKPSDVCGIKPSKEDDGSFSFKGDFDSKEPELRDLLGDDMRLIDLLKKLYDWALLEELRNGEKYISIAKVGIYERHKKDLTRLKELFRADQKQFRQMFRTASDKLDNYPAYSGHGAANHRCDYDGFISLQGRRLHDIIQLKRLTTARLSINTDAEKGEAYVCTRISGHYENPSDY